MNRAWHYITAEDLLTEAGQSNDVDTRNLLFNEAAVHARLACAPADVEAGAIRLTEHRETWKEKEAAEARKE